MPFLFFAGKVARGLQEGGIMHAATLRRRACPEEILAGREENFYPVMKKAFEFAALAASRGEGPEGILAAARRELEEGYVPSMFVYPWMAKARAEDDAKKIERCLSFLLSDGAKVVRTKVPCSLSVPGFGEPVTATADLVLELKGGKIAAVIVSCRKGGRSERGRSLKTKAMAEPQSVVVRAALEDEWPGVIVWQVYLQGPDDAPGRVSPEMKTGGGADSQFHCVTYSEFVKDGAFDRAEFEAFARQAFEAANDPPCATCDRAWECKNGPARLRPDYGAEPPREEGETYRLPKFSAEQEGIIRHGDGAMLVVAGPGSGKTATLVGRLKYLVEEKKVPPEFILAITFTNKAAEEIRKRCASFLAPGEEIRIQTLHALGFSILRDEAETRGEDVSLLTPSSDLDLINDLLLSVGHEIEGFSYNLTYGRTGLFSTVRRRIAEYERNPEGFFEKNPGIGREFADLAERYLSVVREGGYVDYDGQVREAVRILTENPELLSDYQNQFWHVCVDEYQDVDENQSRLIDLLAAGHGNLMAIGDDDQSIYEFRGGTPRFMLDFRERHEGADVIFLSRNYRSRDYIVRLAARNVRSGSLNRYEKEIVAVRAGGDELKVLEGDDLAALALSAVKGCLAEGKRPEDVTVLAWGNATLEEVAAKGEGLPLRMEKELLSRCAFLTFARCVLALFEGRDAACDIRADLLEYHALFSVKAPEAREFYESAARRREGFPFVEEGSLESAAACAGRLFEVLERGADAAEFLEAAADVAGYLASPEYAQSREVLLKRRHVETAAQLLAETRRMATYGDDQRLEGSRAGKVLLTTVHEAKGREWNTVILLDDFGTKESDAVRRLIYVALTRAEEGLILCKRPGESLLVT